MSMPVLPCRRRGVWLAVLPAKQRPDSSPRPAASASISPRTPSPPPARAASPTLSCAAARTSASPSELWDPRYIRDFKKKHAHEIWVEHVATKKDAQDLGAQGLRARLPLREHQEKRAQHEFGKEGGGGEIRMKASRRPRRPVRAARNLSLGTRDRLVPRGFTKRNGTRNHRLFVCEAGPSAFTPRRAIHTTS